MLSPFMIFLISLLVTSFLSFTYGVEQNELIDVLKKMQMSQTPKEARQFFKYDPALPDEYVDAKIDRVLKLNFSRKKVLGFQSGKKLMALALEEKPGDVDPVIFFADNNKYLILLNVTRLRDSGLADDKLCQSETVEITSWLNGIK
jgi:hypothetical protein